jgi:hypothetical protein
MSKEKKTATEKELRSVLGEEAYVKLKKLFYGDTPDDDASVSDPDDNIDSDDDDNSAEQLREKQIVEKAIMKKDKAKKPNDKNTKEKEVKARVKDVKKVVEKLKTGRPRQIITDEKIDEVVRLRSERYTIASIQTMTKLSKVNVCKILRDHAHHAIRN